MTNSGETEKAYAGQQGECALWKARSLAALEEYNGQVCSKYFYCWSEDLVDASVSAGLRAAAATAAQKTRRGSTGGSTERPRRRLCAWRQKRQSGGAWRITPPPMPWRRTWSASGSGRKRQVNNDCQAP